MSDSEQLDLTTLTVELLSAYVANNDVRPENLSDLIQSAHAALSGIVAPTEEPAEPVQQYVGAVTARKSLSSREHIVSMIDGKLYKTLKRHLAGHGLTPESYRERYNLPASYPMVAPAYSEARREVAQRLGLGRKPGKAATETTPERAREPKKDSAAKAAVASKKSTAPRKPRAAKAPPVKVASESASGE